MSEPAKETAAFLATLKTGDGPAVERLITIDDIPHVLRQNDTTLINLESAMDAPRRIRARPELRELESFLSYLADFAQPGSAIFARSDSAGLSATAIIDYPVNQESPSWGDHRVSLRTELSTDFARLTRYNGNNFNQEAFAEFVEDNARLFADPSGADMLTIASEINMTQQVEWKGAVRLTNGDTAVSFVSTTKAGSGNVELPPFIPFAAAVFADGEVLPIRARLRHKLDSGALFLRYEILQLPDLMETATEQILDRIAEATGLTPFIGDTPERV